MATRIVNKLPQFTSAVERKAARSLTQMLILGLSEASVMTPIGDTSNLINSKTRSVRKEGTRIVGSAGYTVDYAAPVHDPAVKQRFRRPTARKEFLKRGFENAEPNIRAVLTGAIKT